MSDKKMTPVLKWAGGKTQLLEYISDNMPDKYNNYYEPFVGGAAVLLGISPPQAFVNDVNQQLVNLYTQLKNDVESVIVRINEMDSVPCTKEIYYNIREQYNIKITQGDFDAECAALMIWINKHCFNGLYRVNSKGLFNVPYNNRVSGKSIDENLDKIGAKAMLSNNDVPLVHSLYKGYNIQSIDVKRMINRNAGKRFGKEVLITNY